MKAFVYAELQISVPFDQAPWREVEPTILQQPGVLNKTWLAGVGNDSLGGIYAFDTVANARSFALSYFPTETAKMNAAFYTRLFGASQVEDASRHLNSPFFV